MQVGTGVTKRVSLTDVIHLVAFIVLGLCLGVPESLGREVQRILGRPL